MSEALRTEVRFRSAMFNTSEPREYFINPGCFGDDVCRWLIQALRARGLATAEEPGQEDFGWFFTFQVDGTEHCFVVGYQEEDPPTAGTWRGWLERQAGMISSLFGARKRGILPAAAQAIHTALSSSEGISDVSWHIADKADDDDRGAPHPTA